MYDPSPTTAREREVFIEAAEIASSRERDAFLKRACAGDDVLKARIEALLNADEVHTLPHPQEWVRNVLRQGIEEMEEPDSPPDPARRGGWTPPSPPRLNALIPDFEVEEMIGIGGMGAVYRCEQKSLERQVAVKILPPEFSNDPAFAGRFRREALAMARLQHPNIVTIFDCGSLTMPGENGNRNLHYIVLELVEGSDLQKIMGRRELDATKILSVLRQICDALEYAHEHGCVHRDIKPANIFVTQGGLVKVGDFGIAKLIDRAATFTDESTLTMAGTSPGTPHYMAPEQFKDPKTADPRSDIYSVGVLLYELLTGSLPKGIFPKPSEVAFTDARLDDIVTKALRSDPAQRYQKAADLRSDLQRLAEGTPPSQTKRPKKRSPKPWAFAAALLLLAGAGWAFISRDAPGPAYDFHQDDPVVPGRLFWTGFAEGKPLPPLRAPLTDPVSVFTADPKPRFVDSDGTTRFVLSNGTTAERSFGPNATQLVTSQRLRAAVFADGRLELHTYMDAASEPSYEEANNLTGVRQVALHDRSLLVLLNDGTLRMIGPDPLPAEWQDIDDVIQIAPNAILRADGTVSTPTASSPSNLDTVTKIASSGGHFVALTRDGQVIAWGNNRSGASDVPSDLPKIVDIVAINRAAGSLALDQTGTWHHWGDDSLGRWKAVLPQLHGVRHLDAYQKGDDIWVVGISPPLETHDQP